MEEGTGIVNGSAPSGVSADFSIIGAYGTGNNALKIKNTSAFFSGNKASLIWTGPKSGSDGTETLYSRIKPGVSLMDFGASASAGSGDYSALRIDQTVTDPVFYFGNIPGAGDAGRNVPFCFGGFAPYTPGNPCFEYDQPNNDFKFYQDIHAAYGTLAADQGIATSTISVTGSTVSINGVTYTGWPSSLSNIPATSTGVFVVNGSSVVSVQPAVTDPAETGVANRFTALNDFSAATLIVSTGTSPTLTATGAFAVDTSSGQVVISTSGTNLAVLQYEIPNSIVIATPTVGDYHFFQKAWTEQTIDNVVCLSSASTSATVQLYECNSSGASCTSMGSDTACTTTETTLSLTDTDIALNDRVKVMVTAVSGTPGEVVIDMRSRETRH